MSSANELWEIYEHLTLVITNDLATWIFSASRSEETSQREMGLVYLNLCSL